jgi:hypothetical protein
MLATGPPGRRDLLMTLLSGDLRWALALRPSVITNLEDGIDSIGRCEYCAETLDMTVAALGGGGRPDMPCRRAAASS